MAKRKKVRRRRLLSLLIFLIIFIGVIIGGLKLYTDYLNKENQKQANILKEKKQKQLAEYNACLVEPFNENNKSSELTSKENAIISYIRQNNYNVSFVYEDVNTGYSFKYREDEVYYGCSLIKLVDTLYLLDKINSGELSFDTKIPYESSYYIPENPCMAKYPAGSPVSIGNVIECALTVSDNIAHRIMINYIGFNALQQYGRSLGAKNILNGGDSYGMQSANDMNIYLKKLNEDIKNYPNTGNVIKGYMNNTYWSHLRYEGAPELIHKYGYYGSYYHDVGIVYDDTPYYMSILTLHGETNFASVTNNVHKKINELHKLYQEETMNNCKNKVYGK